MPVISRAPQRHIGHWLPYYFGNSEHGLQKTADEDIVWHDFDHGLSKDGVWWIGHGSPEKVFLKTGRMRDYTSAAIGKMRHKGHLGRTYGVSRPGELYRLAKKLGLRIEIEPKGKDPRYTERKYWQRLARLCLKVWGPDWRKHVYVKVLKNGDGVFSTEVIKAASSAGFPAGPTRDWTVPTSKETR